VNEHIIKDFILGVIREEFLSRGLKLRTIILFGSRARGTARPESDWDFIVVCKDRPDRALKTDIWLSINRKLTEYRIDADILIKSEEDFERDKCDTGKVSYYALKDGVAV